MNIYYTAKDIEEMAVKGIQQIELGPGVTLTDFARETAQQFNITLVDGSQQTSQQAAQTSSNNISRINSKYNKPKGCQHPSPSFPANNTTVVSPSNSSTEGTNSNTVNRLIDLMGKVVKRGG